MTVHAWRTSVARHLAHACIVGLVAFLFLLPPIPASNRRWCTFETVHVGHGLNYRLDVDSPVFLDLADEPAYFFIGYGEWRSRQARPLYVLVARALTPLVQYTPGLRAMNMHPAYPAYALINLATLIAALGLFVSLVGSSSRAWMLGTLAGVLLFSNGVAKIYTWTPHQQLFNILEPLACAWLIRNIASRQTLPLARIAAYGLGSGILLLAYGNFALLLPAMFLGVAARAQTEPLSRVAAAGVLALGAFIVPLLAWTLYVRHRTGGFHLGEALECRDFVWMADAWRRGGAPQLARSFRLYSANFFGTFGRELVIPFFVAITAVALRMTAWDRTRAVLRERRATLLSCLAACGLNLVFFWLMGNPRFCYAPRLTFTILPPLLAGAAALVAGVTDRSSERTWRAVLVAVALFVIASHAWVVVQPGPPC